MAMAMAPKKKGGSVAVNPLFIFDPIIMWVFMYDSCFVVQYLVSFLVLHHLAGEERADFFTFIDFSCHVTLRTL